MRKKILTFLLIISIFFPIKNTFSYYLPSDNKQISIQTKKTSILLRKHTDSLEKQLKYFEKKLDLENDAKIKSWLEDIEKIKKGLNAIKNDKIDKLKARILIKSIINRLKTINNELKPYLKKSLLKNKEQIKLIKNKYKNIIYRFNNKLKVAINRVNVNLKNKKNINSKDKAIIYHLEKIKKHMILLDGFYKKDFYNTKNLKKYLVSNIKSISYEIKEIKKVIR